MAGTNDIIGIAAAIAKSVPGTAGAAAVAAKEAAEAAADEAQEILESIPEDYSELSADVGDLKSIVKEYTGNLISGGYTEVPGYYIDKTNDTLVLNENLSCIVFPIRPSTTYYIKKDTVTITRAATAVNNNIVVNKRFNAVVRHNTASAEYMMITSGSDDHFMFMQLYGTNDAADLKNNAINVASLIVCATADSLWNRVTDLDAFTKRLTPYNNPLIIEINHRGYNSEAPENTIPAFRLSKKYGYSWVEFDVQITSDNVPVVIHENAINRTARNADGTEIAETVYVSDSTYTELLNYDFGIWKSAAYAGTKIPTLEETVNFCRKVGLKMAVELKGDTVSPQNLALITSVVDNCGMSDSVDYFSGVATLAQAVSQAVSNGIVGLSVASVGSSTLSYLNAMNMNGNKVVLHVDPAANETEQGYLDAIQQAGFGFVFRGHTDAQVLDAPDYARCFISNALHPAEILFDAVMAE